MTDNLIIKIAKSEDEINKAKDVRRQVFQLEQGIDSNLDFDGEDDNADHVIVYLDDKPIGTARIRYIEKDIAKIERVAVLANFRDRKIGAKIMEFISDYLIKKGLKEITLDSQMQVKGFYEKLGYQQKGGLFEEVGIQHIVMVKKLN